MSDAIQNHNDLVKLHEKKVKLHQKNDGWFVGPRIVKEAVVNEDLGLVAILYDDEGEETLSVSQWEAVRAKAEYPQDQVSKRRFASVIRQIQLLIVDNTKDEKTRIDVIMDVLVKERADLNSFSYILQNAGEPFKKFESLIHQRVQDVWNRTVSLRFGVEHQSQITLQELVDFVKSGKVEETEESSDEETSSEETSA